MHNDIEDTIIERNYDGEVRFAAITAISGALFLLVGTFLHPMHEDPNMPLAAFTEYAADHNWVFSHLMQLSGVALMVASLVLLSRRIVLGPAGAAATLGAVSAVASLAVAAALQAVDGIALKAMVDTWAKAQENAKEALFNSALAVRQIEIGLASIDSLLFGVTVTLYGFVLLKDPHFPKWLGVLALAGGVPTAIAGIVIAYTGFSELDMAINMPANFLLLCWMILLGIYMWRKPSL
ncbi:DUF4386 family protein [Neobacillus massiliamazoniensis]|uniref:DUF4386 family protein n=1 Tax=Neobacillus massiliamazoniensis TaxID=1499688 RepID=A0A0U1P4I5_9BACI|nr:DUF4386 family protein [Neobacillus massiliamazoniensis]CRK85205.1 hypothetical protein BN000_05277 [Neobacillus massiliamazoniensis]